MQPKVKRVYVPKLKLLAVLASGVILLILFTKIIFWSNTFVRETGLSIGTVVRLLVNGGAPIPTFSGHTNILLMGIGGGVHTGADLTDTMIVLSLGKSSLAFISIPRDIWSDTLKDKVNSAYHYGEEKKEGGGLILAKAIIEDVIGIPIHYGFVIDFSGFTKVIDIVHGLQIDVSHGFIDLEFPIEGKENDLCGGDPQYRCRYEVVQFDEGPQFMDGERALKYVRSRGAMGEQGTDFARSRRQQEVIVALKERIMTPSVWLSPARAKLLLEAISRATDTDMNIGELLTVGKRFAGVDGAKTKHISLENELYSPPAIWYGRYVLIPKENFESLHEYLKKELEEETNN